MIEDNNETKTTKSVQRQTRKVSFFLGILCTLTFIFTIQIGLWVYGLIRHSELNVLSERIDLNRIMQNDPDTFWALQPNMNNVEVQPQPSGPPHGFHVSTNDLALRNPPVKAKGNRIRILAIGDSTTFGQYVEDSETWPAQLQSILDKDASKIEVINAGLIGATSFQGLAYLLKRGFDLKPDIVIATYGFNDRGRWNVADRLGAQKLGQTDWGSKINMFLQNHQQTASTTMPRVSAGEFLDIMMIMATECESRNIKLYFNIWPSPCNGPCDWKAFSPLEYKSLIPETAFRSQAKVIDLRQAFHDATENPFVDVVHASPSGCRIAAEVIASSLQSELQKNTSIKH